MSAQSPDFETSKTTMVGADHTTDSTSNGEQFTSDSIQKKNGVVAEHTGDGSEYATGWLLAAVLLTILCNSISGAYFVTAAQSIFANRLLKTLACTAPSIDTAEVLRTGASNIHRVFSGGDLAAVLNAYMVGIKGVFAFSLAGAAFTVLVALMIPFKKVPGQNNKEMKEVIA